jgi:Rrf2 family cysteine metabolism transcriptional repressor
MLFSAKAEYACLAMLELAARHGDPKPVRLADVAETHRIPQRFLVQILLQLKGAGLVASTRGAAGGYHLARPPEEVSLNDILGVIERNDPSAGGRKVEPSSLSSALHGVWEKVALSRRSILEQTSLADLLAAGQGLQYVI